MRWLLIVPLGLYEIVLLLIAYICALFKPLHPVTRVLYNHAKKLPDAEWYKQKEGQNDA